MSKFQKMAAKVHPRDEKKPAAQTANKGKPTTNNSVKPLTKNQKYSGTT